MKQFVLVSIAIVLALLLSAFTPTNQAYYFDGITYQPVPNNIIPCEEGDGPQCHLFFLDALRPLYKDNIGTPWRSHEKPRRQAPLTHSRIR